MKFNRSTNKDDLLFVIALLLPAVFAGARYVESSREMDLIAAVHPQAQAVARDGHRPERLHLAYAQSHGR
jgi:hypothetical protein